MSILLRQQDLGTLLITKKDHFRHALSKPPPLTQITARRDQRSPEQTVTSTHPRRLAAPFQVTSTSMAPAQPRGGAGPRELPGNFLSGVMFKLGYSPPPACLLPAGVPRPPAAKPQHPKGKGTHRLPPVPRPPWAFPATSTWDSLEPHTCREGG